MREKRDEDYEGEENVERRRQELRIGKEESGKLKGRGENRRSGGKREEKRGEE